METLRAHYDRRRAQGKAPATVISETESEWQDAIGHARRIRPIYGVLDQAQDALPVGGGARDAAAAWVRPSRRGAWQNGDGLRRGGEPGPEAVPRRELERLTRTSEDRSARRGPFKKWSIPEASGAEIRTLVHRRRGGIKCRG
jgi:hypothetical protein